MESELKTNLGKLPLDNNLIFPDTIKNKRGLIDSRKLRKIVRFEEFNKWYQLPQKGKGVSLYQDFTPANRWVRHHTGLSSSEWRDALKMTGNVAPVRAIPGRTQDNNHCRRCHSEVETLAHVLGSCPFGETADITKSGLISWLSTKLGTWGLVSVHGAKRPDFDVNNLPLPARRVNQVQISTEFVHTCGVTVSASGCETKWPGFESQSGKVTWLRFFPGFSLNPIRANAE
ncbi:hypothetical protein ANN_27300 [Periplaneta americana]|uniref:Reverse transcriptase zinc-binding domain-containing protein n=1 Tax=Periplaneta americana TaxID=6978 RepID=A0ABQ8RXN7_PERAM|nr:hypothetical protein ANN_27300 [Periplaneta americana]